MSLMVKKTVVIQSFVMSTESFTDCYIYHCDCRGGFYLTELEGGRADFLFFTYVSFPFKTVSRSINCAQNGVIQSAVIIFQSVFASDVVYRNAYVLFAYSCNHT